MTLVTHEFSAGQRFRQLTILQASHRGRVRGYDCRCDCGTVLFVRSHDLAIRGKRSCGCHFRASRAERATTEYHIWQSMRQRCSNPGHVAYARYGGRGIRVCERWDSYENFLADMGRRPSLRHSLDRMDTNGNYEPNNCRWATWKEQHRNRRNNVLVEFRGETMTLAAAGELIGRRVRTSDPDFRSGALGMKLSGQAPRKAKR